MSAIIPKLDPNPIDVVEPVHIGWLWRAPVRERTPGRGWVFRTSLDGRTYPEGSEFVAVYSDGAPLP